MREIRKKNRIGNKLTFIILVLGVVMALGTVMAGAYSAGEAETTAAPLERLTLVAPPGPLAIPMVYLVVNNRLGAIAHEIEFFIWENPGQLRAIIAGGQADLVTLPSNAAAVFYNKGLGVQLLDITVWNILHVISSDPTITTFADLVGQKIVVPFQGSMPDLLFQYVTMKQGLDTFTDLQVQYAANPRQAAQFLLAGKTEHAVLPEPLATIVLLQTKGTDRPLQRAIRFKTEFDNLGLRTAIAGTVALPSMQERPDLIRLFLEEYRLAIAWMIENPAEAGAMAEEHLPELGFKAGPVAASLKNISWEFVLAQDAREEIELFFTELMKLSPAVVGGELPGDGFYFYYQEDQ